MHRQPLVRFLRADDGAAAAEFALVLPLFILLTLGLIGLGTLMYKVTTLHAATEDAARCFSVKVDVCPDSATTIAYAEARYQGPGPAPVFTADDALQPCGRLVTATSSFAFQAGLVKLSVPINADACFPA